MEAVPGFKYNENLATGSKKPRACLEYIKKSRGRRKRNQSKVFLNKKPDKFERFTRTRKKDMALLHQSEDSMSLGFGKKKVRAANHL